MVFTRIVLEANRKNPRNFVIRTQGSRTDDPTGLIEMIESAQEYLKAGEGWDSFISRGHQYSLLAYLEDIAQHNLTAHLGNMGIAFLGYDYAGPVDQTVVVDPARSVNDQPYWKQIQTQITRTTNR